MIVSINQPAYLPWLGYFHRIALSDLHIVLDHVQFEKNSVTNRNKIRTKDGWCWLTVPVKTKGRFGNLPIQDLEIDNLQSWSKKHLNALRSNYARAPHFVEHEPFFGEVYTAEWPRFAPLARKITHYLLEKMEIATPMRYSSEMTVQGEKSDLVLNLCKAVGATTYLSGPFGRDYLNEGAFSQSGIEVRYHDYQHPSYAQVYDGFEPHMSAVDLLFNCGAESGQLLKEVSTK